jgi:hypothetical protein
MKIQLFITHVCHNKYEIRNNSMEGREIFENREEKELEDIKGVIRIRKSKKDRQHNGQKKKYHC